MAYEPKCQNCVRTIGHHRSRTGKKRPNRPLGKRVRSLPIASDGPPGREALGFKSRARRFHSSSGFTGLAFEHGQISVDAHSFERDEEQATETVSHGPRA
jgi:hypothetical protein